MGRQAEVERLREIVDTYGWPRGAALKREALELLDALYTAHTLTMLTGGKVCTCARRKAAPEYIGRTHQMIYLCDLHYTCVLWLIMPRVGLGRNFQQKHLRYLGHKRSLVCLDKARAMAKNQQNARTMFTALASMSRYRTTAFHPVRAEH